MPRAPKKCGRLDCHERVIGTAYCAAHAAERLARSSWGRGSTRQSRKQRAIVLADNPTCYLRYPGCIGVATEDDHVIPISQGGSDDLTNRSGACAHCHRIKSQREAAIGRGAEPAPF
jgi:5-methylcytosine-specific restriction protein A